MKRQTVASLALSLLLAAPGQLSLAQGLEAGAAGTLSQLSAIGPDQDSLLPPEVVPLDPSVAARLSQEQAQSRAVSTPAFAPTQAAPVAPAANMGGFQSAQDFRKEALNSLMNQQSQWNGQMPQQFAAPQQNAFIGQPVAGLNSAPGAFPSQLAQAPLVPGNGGSDVQLGQSAWQPGSTAQSKHGSHTQSQTLTGGTKHKQYRRDTRRGGITNTFSALAGFGSGLMVGSAVRNPNTAFGLGMFGLGMTGFGTRNGFRF